MIERTLKDGRVLCVSVPTPSDAQALVDYLQIVGGESDFLTFGHGEFWLSVTEEARFIEEVRGRGNEIFLKGVVEGAIVSSLSLLRANRARLQHIAELGISVLKSHWGLGIARHMCEIAIDQAKDLRISKINLHVRTDNQVAYDLYRKLGFQDEGVSSRAYQINAKYYSNRLMGLELD